jgi:glutamine amidotransferase
MCLAIYKPKGAVISPENLQSGFYSNCSGSGFMFAERGQVKVVKGLMSFKELHNHITDVGQKEHAMGIHFRAATHGPVNDANCHPFSMCDGKYAMIHNGIFRVPIRRTDLSDTGNFCIQVLEPAIQNGSYKNRREMKNHPQWGWGAVVLFNGDGEVVIYNEEMGHWNGDVWYSNHAYEFGRYGQSRDYFRKQTEEEYKPKARPGYGGDYWGSEDY